MTHDSESAATKTPRYERLDARTPRAFLEMALFLGAVICAAFGFGVAASAMQSPSPPAALLLWGGLAIVLGGFAFYLQARRTGWGNQMAAPENVSGHEKNETALPARPMTPQEKRIIVIFLAILTLICLGGAYVLMTGGP